MGGPERVPALRLPPDLAALLESFLAASRGLLGEQFIALYLGGSLALGDFDPATSDLDFIVVTAEDLAPERVAALAALHRQLAAGPGRWGAELDGSYIPRRALRRYDPADNVHPHVESGVGRLQVEPHDSDWIIQRHVVREAGVALAGPSPSSLIDPVAPAALREATLALLRGWWAGRLEDPAYVAPPHYQAYAVLTMCRILYTLEHGTIVPKPVAAAYTRQVHPRWGQLISRALDHALDAATLPQTLDLIRYTLEQARAGETRQYHD